MSGLGGGKLRRPCDKTSKGVDKDDDSEARKKKVIQEHMKDLYMVIMTDFTILVLPTIHASSTYATE